jgi:hypothetical protein
MAPALRAQEHRHEHAGADGMTGLLGPYPMAREASGTSWQPEDAPMEGVHAMAGGWMFMLHGFADVVYDDQGGPRGDEKTLVPSMLMAMGRRDVGDGALGARVMLSLDPLMGRAGYPLLFQTGETADGATPLVDRQHPHDFFMELAGTYSHPVGAGSVFAYAGLPGEPALGPPTFMHRASGADIPEAPLSHHWLDSTHITFGVLTLGATTAQWKVEGSVFNGREPDQNRWNIETDRMDSYAGRLTWNPAPCLSLQASYGYLVAPEQLEPDENLHRATASVSCHALMDEGYWSTMFAAGSNRQRGHDSPAFLYETTIRVARDALFARAEWLKNEELFDAADPLAGEYEIGKLTLGGMRDLAAVGRLTFGAGALVSAYAVPSAIEPVYGENPVSVMVLLRTRIR